ncbi:hypothetical protein [Streptomyces sp. NPDC003943]
MNTTQRTLAAALLAAAALGLAAAPHALAADGASDGTRDAGLVGLLGLDQGAGQGPTKGPTKVLDHGPDSGDQQATVSGNDSVQSIG